MKISMRSTIGIFAATCALSSHSAFAQSSVSLYGLADVYAGVVKNPGSNSALVEQGGGMSTSYWGIKGSEDLGGDVKAIFTLESFFQPQNGQVGRFPGDAFFARNAYVGIESPYGTFTAGRQATQLFVSSLLFNPFVDSFTFSPIILQTYLGLGVQGTVGGNQWSNAIAYSSPEFSGLSGGAMYSFGNAAGESGQRKWSAQFLYFNGPFAATGVYQYENYSTVAGDIGTALPGVPGLTSQTTGEVGVSYDFRIVKLYAQYINTQDRATSGGFSVNTAQLGSSIPLGVGSVLASYAYSKNGGPLGSSARRSTWAVGYDYPLSKRTDVYAAYLSDRITGQSGGDTLGIGLRLKF